MALKSKKNVRQERWNYKTMFGPYMNFAATEGYKLLRTNIMFSFPDEGKCRVIGISSATASEGKSSTACNTVYALQEAGARALLLEADLRRPTIASKLGLARVPGLTNLLVAKWTPKEVVQHCSAAPDMDVITSGDIPPNPSELLGSPRMAQLLEELKGSYDYIILDLPPITAVSDALAASKLLDGIILVVRDGVSNQQFLAEALRQINLVDVRILGFVYRDSGETSGKYRSKYKYRYKYYKAYLQQADREETKA